MTILLAAVLLIIVFMSFFLPWIKDIGHSVTTWGSNNVNVEIIENHISRMAQSPERRVIIDGLRNEIISFVENNKSALAEFAFDSGTGVIYNIVRMLGGIGSLLINLLLSIFFFFYFLQKMALFETREKSRSVHVMTWGVRSIFDSPWLPSVSDQTKENAVRILSHIGSMLGKWARGYCMIILVESIAYSTAFFIIGVPYAPLAGIVAGMTILLPVIGLLGSLTLTIGLCLAFCHGGVILTIGLALLTYAIICTLEGGVMLPYFVGGALGMTVIETIIVVLLGGMFFGIIGMVFALPMSAVIKYLVPEIYRAAEMKEEK